MSKIIFVIGGCKSGKSSFAQKLCLDTYAKKRIYVATGVITDEEMERRVKRHKEERKGLFESVECPYELVNQLREMQDKDIVILVDCLTMWINNLLFKGLSFEQIEAEIDKFIDVITNGEGTVVLVSNEVGLGIVPIDKISRKFRDLVGILHQKVASKAHQVYFMVCGIPSLIKG